MISKLFEVAANKMANEEDKKVVEGLRKLVGQVEQDLYTSKPRYIDAFFFPNEANIQKIVKYIGRAQRSLKICVFNFTNNDLSKAVLDRYKNGVDVRIVTDDECMTNKGSDIQFLANNGVPCRTDSEAAYHMHNKFMIVDDTFLLTGSFNWTVQAGLNNQENLLVVDNPYYIEKYSKEFERLWMDFESN